ncbi:hypothetical protein LCGC14_2258990 [marine sediment metagenome]|uniref:PD-(D/E)XK endonuclease-like domain-containing protein n=1 Tax=marine sediment metagenome TaxID=412755 RepID=A0A0F9FCS1_9ZZZZ
MRPQSATSIADYKRCSILFYLCHVLRLRPIEKAESLRQGTNWHKCLEILTMVPGKCPVSTYHFSDGPVCPVCENTGFIRKDADMREALFRYMNEAYATCPPSIDLIDWETEQTILLYSAIGWDWYWGNDKVDTIAREVHFAREINSIYSRRGTIDRIIQRGGTISLGEYKSTSKPIDPGAFYWSHLKLDSQLTMYLIEARHMQLAGELRQYGIKATDPLISGMLYDVWHKPKIKPKKLTQANTKKFIASGEYFGEKFKITESRTEIYVNGVEVETSIGALPKVTKKNPNIVIEIETNGTIKPLGGKFLGDVIFNVSPKLKNSGNEYKKRIIYDTLGWFSEMDANFKFVINSPDDIDEVNLFSFIFEAGHYLKAKKKEKEHRGYSEVFYYLLEGFEDSEGIDRESFLHLILNKRDAGIILEIETILRDEITNWREKRYWKLFPTFEFDGFEFDSSMFIVKNKKII